MSVLSTFYRVRRCSDGKYWVRDWAYDPCEGIEQKADWSHCWDGRIGLSMDGARRVAEKWPGTEIVKVEVCEVGVVE